MLFPATATQVFNESNASPDALISETRSPLCGEIPNSPQTFFQFSSSAERWIQIHNFSLKLATINLLPPCAFPLNFDFRFPAFPIPLSPPPPKNNCKWPPKPLSSTEYPTSVPMDLVFCLGDFLMHSLCEEYLFPIWNGHQCELESWGCFHMRESQARALLARPVKVLKMCKAQSDLNPTL